MTKKKGIIFIVFIMLFSLSSLLITFDVKINDTPIEASLLKATCFTPILDAKINTGENLIYCSTFKLAWDSICKEVKIENASEYDKLNDVSIDPIDTTENSYITMSGFIKEGILDQIDNTLKDKFSIPFAVNKNMSSNSFFLYSYLKKIITPNKLTKHYYPSRFLNLKNSIETLSRISSLEFIYDNGPNESTCALKGYFPKGSIIKIAESTNEDIIISTIILNENLLRCYENINDMINDINNKVMIKNKYGKKPLLSEMVKYFNFESRSPEEIRRHIEQEYEYLLRPHGYYSLWLPILNINIINLSFIKSLNKKSKNKIEAKYDVIDSININFSLGNNVSDIDSRDSSSVVNTQLSFLDPFIIYIKNKQSKYPYFIAYIGNDELLVKSNVDYEEFWKKYFENYKRKMNSN